MGNNALKKIMIVDDDDDTLTIARFCLEDLKELEIKCVRSSEEAIDQVLGFKPDMILLDVMMPRMDGVATLKALRLMPDAAQIPIVFFTAKAQQEELSSYRQMGVVDIITKPFDPLSFADRVLQIWEQCKIK